MYDRKDHYWKKAKAEGYRSRAAYKLLEIQRRHRILRGGNRGLDLGCAPGGWLQVIAPEVGPSGRVVGVDRLTVRPLPFPWVEILRGDLLDPSFRDTLQASLEGKVHVVTSDMAPDTTGIGFQDHVRSCALVREALEIARRSLVPGGVFLAKVFQGEESQGLKAEAGLFFSSIRWVVPVSSRKESSEVYLLGNGFGGEPSPVPRR